MKHHVRPLQSVRLLDQMREQIRYEHYNLATEKVYLYRLRFFVRWSTGNNNGRMRRWR